MSRSRSRINTVVPSTVGHDVAMVRHFLEQSITSSIRFNKCSGNMLLDKFYELNISRLHKAEDNEIELSEEEVANLHHQNEKIEALRDHHHTGEPFSIGSHYFYGVEKPVNFPSLIETKQKELETLPDDEVENWREMISDMNRLNDNGYDHDFMRLEIDDVLYLWVTTPEHPDQYNLRSWTIEAYSARELRLSKAPQFISGASGAFVATLIRDMLVVYNSRTSQDRGNPRLGLIDVAHAIEYGRNIGVLHGFINAFYVKWSSGHPGPILRDDGGIGSYPPYTSEMTVNSPFGSFPARDADTFRYILQNDKHNRSEQARLNYHKSPHRILGGAGAIEETLYEEEEEEEEEIPDDSISLAGGQASLRVPRDDGIERHFTQPSLFGNIASIYEIDIKSSVASDAKRFINDLYNYMMYIFSTLTAAEMAARKQVTAQESIIVHIIHMFFISNGQPNPNGIYAAVLDGMEKVRSHYQRKRMARVVRVVE